jgi:formylglycine-generating enzyme required for sulfatase activity
MARKPIVQRMRYIEAGHFRMGSPAPKPSAMIHEGPQHAVTLTQGFWLADSACTQALWQAVMGDNPSHFTAENHGGAQHPVEQVSWDDVQLFLRRLEARLPGAAAPACRARPSGSTRVVPGPRRRSASATTSRPSR